MKRTITAAALVMALAIPAFGADAGTAKKGPAPDFEQKKATHLKMIDERIANLQQEKECLQAAKNHEEAKECRKKFKGEMKKDRHEMREKRKEMKKQ